MKSSNVYFTLEQCLLLIEEPMRSALWKIATSNHDRFVTARGSSHNHQAWEGGYMDHIREVLNIAVFLYEAMNHRRLLPFTLEDALIVLYLHDIEKPWKNEFKLLKSERPPFRQATLDQYSVVLTEQQHNAFRYVEGENDDYTPERRVMNELAAFCHMCDIASARVWHNRPGPFANESWGWRWIDGPPKDNS